MESDFRDLHEYLSSEEIYRFEPGKPISVGEAKILCRERSKGTEFLAAALKSDSLKLVGHVSFIQEGPRHFLTWEIGFIFNPAYQNKGYATEASRAIIRYAFDKMEAHRIVAYCSTENAASWKVLEKCGMKLEGTRRQNAYFQLDENGQPCWTDSYAYAILKDDLT